MLLDKRNEEKRLKAKAAKHLTCVKNKVYSVLPHLGQILSYMGSTLKDWRPRRKMKVERNRKHL